MRHNGYGGARPSIHPRRFTTAPWFWITVCMLSAGCPTAAARSCSPWAVNPTTWSGLPRFAYRQHADHLSQSASPAPPPRPTSSLRPGAIAPRDRSMDRGTPRQTAAHYGSVALAGIVADRVRASMAGEDVGTHRAAPGAWGPPHGLEARRWTLGTATKPDSSKWLEALLATERRPAAPQRVRSSGAWGSLHDLHSPISLWARDGDAVLHRRRTSGRRYQ